MSPNDISKCLMVVMAVIVGGAVIAERFLPAHPLTRRTHVILLALAVIAPIGLGLAGIAQLDTVSPMSVAAMIAIPCWVGGATLAGCHWRDGQVKHDLDRKAHAATARATAQAAKEAEAIREAVHRDGEQ